MERVTVIVQIQEMGYQVLLSRAIPNPRAAPNLKISTDT